MNLPKVIFFFGLPGSGKGTQANLIADKFGYFHFDTGKEIEKIIHDPAIQDDPVVKRERNLFDTGFLCTPSWVEEMVKSRVSEYLKAEKKLVFSGTPRTIPEAQGFLSHLLKQLTKDVILIFLIKNKEETSIFRNSHRRVCGDCRLPVIWSKETEVLGACPRCGGKLFKRSLDVEDVIKERIREYRERTEPALDYLKEQGVKIIEVDGEKSPEEVAKEITQRLDSENTKP